MADHLYGYSSTDYGGESASAAAAAAAYASQSLAEPYLPLSYTYDPSKTSVTQPTWPPGVDIPSSAVDSLTQLRIKRSYEALYNQSLLAAHGTIGQSEAWYSANYLAKRPRPGFASDLPVYPQRPGEKDCAHYMQTRTCKFGETCKFDHPIWVPEGGIPDWKEIPIPTTPESLPVRSGAPDCPFFMKTQLCKFGSRCRFNHPQDNLTSGSSENAGSSILPERAYEPPCAFYMKTGKCKYGATCKFNHPKDIQKLVTGQQDGNGLQTDSAVNSEVQPTLALMHNTKGLPVRPGEVDCPFYLKTGSCKYGVTCRYNHPDRNAIIPPAVAYSLPVIASSGASLGIGVVNPLASIYQTIDPRLTLPTLSVGASIYPQRPGHTECDYYMKTGVCKYGETCRFHHPVERSVASTHSEQNVKLTLAGLPRREGAIHCPYYLKTGTCKYSVTCKFDHPPPAEIMAGAASQGASTTVDDEKEDDKDAEG